MNRQTTIRVSVETPRALVIAESLPYPVCVGKDFRNWQNVWGLAQIGRVGVFGLCSNDPKQKELPPIALEFWRASSDPALAYPSPKNRAITCPMEPLGHPSDCYFSQTAAAEISAIVNRYQPDLVVLEGLWLYRYIEYLRPFNCRIILDCHNVEAALAQTVAATLSQNEFPA